MAKAKKVQAKPRVLPWDYAEALLGSRALLGRLLAEVGDDAVLRACHASLDHIAEDQAAYFMAVARGEEQSPHESAKANGKELRRLAMNCTKGDHLAGARLMEMARKHGVPVGSRDAFAIADDIMGKLRRAS